MNKKSNDLEMKMDYDLKNDSLFMYNTSKTHYNESVEVGDYFILDLNEEFTPISFEILNISKILNVGKFSIQHLRKLRGSIGISKDSITIELEFTVPVHQKEFQKPVILEVPNDSNLPNILANVELAKA